MREFEIRVLNNIKQFNLIEKNDVIVAGVSGGPDSIAMLECLNNFKVSKELNFNIVVAHINHGLRENAKLDEAFVKKYCKIHNIECYVLHSNVGELAKESKRGLEETGRNVRYDFFNQIAKKVNANKIAIAHNKKDNVETIIMNILRGSGISGLRGIEPIENNYIRPLINESRENIENYLRECNIIPRIDESNFENEYTRNKIRNIVIPYIEKEFNPNFIEVLTRLSLIVKEEDNYLQQETIKQYENILIEEKIQNYEYNIEDLPTIILDLKLFNSLDKVIQKRVILFAIKRLFGTTKGIEKVHIDDIIKLCNNNIGNKFLTPNKKTKIVIKNKKIYILSKKQ